jgi:hypothetical protein
VDVADFADIALGALPVSFATGTLFAVERSTPCWVDDNALSICIATSVRYAQNMWCAIWQHVNVLPDGPAHGGSALRHSAGHKSYRRRLANT